MLRNFCINRFGNFFFNKGYLVLISQTFYLYYVVFI